MLCCYFSLTLGIDIKVYLVFPGRHLENGSVFVPKSKFDNKIEASSAKMYFHYYGQLLHQQNMLQDYVRTGYNCTLITMSSYL